MGMLLAWGVLVQLWQEEIPFGQFGQEEIPFGANMTDFRYRCWVPGPVPVDVPRDRTEGQPGRRS